MEYLKIRSREEFEIFRKGVLDGFSLKEIDILNIHKDKVNELINLFSGINKTDFDDILMAESFIRTTFEFSKEQTHCYICKNDMEYTCEKCGENICYECTVKMTYHNQIDFSCCKNCDPSNK